MFKRTILSIAALTLAASAFATPGGEGNNTGCNGVGNANSPCGTTNNTTNQGGQGGTSTATAGAIAVGVGIADAAVLGSGNSSVRNSLTNNLGLSNEQEQAQRQHQNQQQSNSQGQQALATSEGGAGGSGSAVATGNGTGNSTVTKVAVDASTRVERSAPGVNVGSQTAPIVDCRRTIGGGASSPGGSGVVSGFPLWEEDTCLKAMAVDLMNKSPAGTFTNDDYQEVACTNAFVAKTKTCKQREESKKVEGILEQRAAVAELKL